WSAAASASALSSMPNRRAFLEQAGAAGLGLGLARVFPSVMTPRARSNGVPVGQGGEPTRLTILQTADIHGQLAPHDEFFWEGDRPVFRERGGFATLRTMVAAIRGENPGNVYLLDGGDCFQG